MVLEYLHTFGIIWAMNVWGFHVGVHIPAPWFASGTHHQHQEFPWWSPFGYGSIPINTIFRGWTSIYQLFWCWPGVQGFDTLPFLGWFSHDLRSGFPASTASTSARRRRSEVAMPRRFFSPPGSSWKCMEMWGFSYQIITIYQSMKLMWDFS